jgi:colicin import membrane protein
MRRPRASTSPFKRALIVAGLCHLALFAVLLVRFSFDSSDKKQLVINPDQVPVQAVVINENELKSEIQRLEKLEQKKINDQLAKERAVKEAEQKIIREKEAEKKRLADLQKQKVVEQKRVEEAKKQAVEAEKQKKIAQQKAEKQRVADAAKAKVAAELTAKQAAEAKIAADKLAAAQAAKNAAASAEALREIERYKAMVRQQIMRYWVVQGGLAKQDATKLFVRVAPTGTVLDVKVMESSGNDALDRSAIAAVYKASPLPVPQDPDLFRSFRELRLTLRPDSILSEG